MKLMLLTIITVCINNTGSANQTIAIFAFDAGHSGAAAGQTVLLTPGDTSQIEPVEANRVKLITSQSKLSSEA